MSENPAQEPRTRHPGDLTPGAEVARMIRVDHAGEYGARRIYEGQLAVLGSNAGGGSIRRMYDQELEHLERFEKLMVARRVRPTVLQPLWHVAGFALGAATAMMGEGVVIRLELSACDEITAEHLASATPAIEPGDIVAIDTGWAGRWETPDWTRHPYLSSEATDWLIDKGVKLIAVDTINPDLPYDLRPEGFDFPVHCSLLSRGILIAEQIANLEPLSGKRAEFFFGALSIKDCDGAPTRILARATE